MKVSARKWRNTHCPEAQRFCPANLNESPSKKEGKFMLFEQASIVGELASMKVSPVGENGS